MKKIKHFIKTRKVSSILIILVVAGLAYYAYGKIFPTTFTTSYFLTNARIGTVSTNITGTGQVSASSQIDITSKVSGDIVFLNSSINGTEIKRGTLIAQIDARDAEIALESSRIAYQKLVKPADASTLLQSQNALSDAISSNAKSYDDAVIAITNTFVDLPTTMTGLDNMLYSQTGYLQSENIRSIGQKALEYQEKAGISYDKAKALYESMKIKYQSYSTTNSTSTTQSFISEVYNLTKSVSEALKNAQNTIDFVRQQRTTTSGDSAAASLATWSATINSDSTNLLSSINTIKSSTQSVLQKKVDLLSVQDGADELDIASQLLTLKQKEYDYQNYFIRAPFDGLLAKLSVKSTDRVNSGTSIATLVSHQKIATISLNEVDAVNVKVGQKAQITFDAIEGLKIEGTVVSVDQVGTVSSGIVSYNTEISFDTQDDRVKSGMSVSVSIITNTHENVLIVPNSAIKTQGNLTFVESFIPALTVLKGVTGTPSEIPPQRKKVEVGLVDDTYTEIISGLNEGDQIVTRTVTGSVSAAKTTNTSSILSGNRSGATGGVRIPRN